MPDSFEYHQFFCNNPQCPLHLKPGGLEIPGTGNWAILDNGCIVGRGRYEGIMLCDPCGRRAIAAATNPLAHSASNSHL